MKGALSWPFMRLYVLTLFYFSANAIVNVIIPMKGESLGADNATIGLIMGAYMITTMFFRPWAGSMIHKHGAAKVLRAVIIIHGLALILYAFAGIGGYFVARMLQGACTAFFSMCLQIGIIDALPDEDRSQGISLYSLFSYIPGILGPLIAVGIWESEWSHGFASTMILIAILTGIAGYSATADSTRAGISDQGAVTRKSISQLLHNRHLFKCSALMLAASIAFGAVTTFIPLYAAQIEGGHAGIYLMLQAGTVVIARFALRKRIPSDGQWHTAFLMGIMIAVTVAAQLVGLAAIGGSLLLYIGAVLMGVAQALLYPTLTTYLSFVLPQSNRNVQVGIFIATADLGVSLGAIAMGPLADISSYSTMYMICSGLCAAMIVFAYERPKANYTS